MEATCPGVGGLSGNRRDCWETDLLKAARIFGWRSLRAALRRNSAVSELNQLLQLARSDTRLDAAVLMKERKRSASLDTYAEPFQFWR